ncbi:Kef-type K+ ransport system, predicted NAD-binding component [Mycolicibacterium chubuense NBB4]|uniref:Kef-type K+ ransport system, predicted NAD-binding component n=1 Tax=Mycolicibacterium chubuense (strain NBB4) TaxID=710421 RepID=I4BP92_MYCCN|nr:potassium channel family protein [Mycolicibacterium chubuense]AFM19099.1 Kef-type K+ ransport system, predicted NAD-binding component [Mycolicibacterium chubuense NBB4]
MTAQTKLDAWEQRTEWPLAGAAVIFLVAYAVGVLDQPAGAAAAAVGMVTAVTWALFAMDYVVRLWLAPRRWRWFYRHLFDLAIVVLPLLRPLRLLRLVTLIAVLQRAAGRAIRGRVVLYTVSGAILLVFVASLAVLEAERGQPDAHIVNFADALWWSMTTITTVGYGDMTPVSTTGRVIAVLLMIGGISLVGSITATLASWIVQRVADEDNAGRVVTTAHIERLMDEIQQLRGEVQRLQGVPARGDRPDG